LASKDGYGLGKKQFGRKNLRNPQAVGVSGQYMGKVKQERVIARQIPEVPVQGGIHGTKGTNLDMDNRREKKQTRR